MRTRGVETALVPVRGACRPIRWAEDCVSETRVGWVCSLLRGPGRISAAQSAPGRSARGLQSPCGMSNRAALLDAPADRLAFEAGQSKSASDLLPLLGYDPRARR